jgi:hypothetical protein
VIGFEFETSALINWSEGGLGDKEDALVSHQAGKYFDHTWRVGSDTGRLEVVTEPFDDEADDEAAEVERMVDVFTQISRFTDLLLAGGGADVTVTPGTLGDIARLADPGKEGVEVTGPNVDSLAASPQATIGFTLDKIAMAARSIVNTDLSIFEEAERSVREEEEHGISLSGMNPIQGSWLNEAALRARVEGRRIGQEIGPGSWPPPAAYEGFLTIVISYLLMGNRQREKWNYYKLIAPLMSRVSLHQMYQDAEVRPYAENFFSVERVLRVAGIDDGSPEDGAMLYRKGLSGNKANIERAAWIQSIRDGKDLLAAFDKAFDSGSMSALDDKNHRAANGKRLYQLELRRLPQVISPEDWADLAKNLYDISRAWRAAD